MIDVEAKKAEIEEAFKESVEAGDKLIKALDKLRSIQLEGDTASQDDINTCMTLGRDIDQRTIYILRAILVRHGNVLFL